MKLEEQITSLELSLKLRVLGVNQTESLHYWREKDGKYNLTEGDIVASAFTAEEMFEHLPMYVSVAKAGGGRHGTFAHYIVCSNQNSREGNLQRAVRGQNPFYHYFNEIDRNLANALAKMWLSLKDDCSTCKHEKEKHFKHFEEKCDIDDCKCEEYVSQNDSYKK